MNVTHDFDQLIDSFSFPPCDFYTTSLFLSYFSRDVHTFSLCE